MKLVASLAFGAVASCAFCQMGPPPGGPGGRGQGGPPMNQASGQSQAPSRGQNQAGQTTETIRILGLRNVQSDLGLAATQAMTLAAAVRSSGNALTTEDAALATVAKVLTAAQITRLMELLVQDLGYGALALARVRTALDLSSEQTTQVAILTSTLDAARKNIAASPNGPTTLAQLRATTNAALAKLLTAEQDAELRALAGRTL